MVDYAAVLVEKFLDSEWSLDGESYDGLTWLDDSPKPSQSELDKLWPTVEKARNERAASRMKARESALSKLTKLGLTQDEITALIDA